MFPLFLFQIVMFTWKVFTKSLDHLLLKLFINHRRPSQLLNLFLLPYNPSIYESRLHDEPRFLTIWMLTVSVKKRLALQMAQRCSATKSCDITRACHAITLNGYRTPRKAFAFRHCCTECRANLVIVMFWTKPEPEPNLNQCHSEKILFDVFVNLVTALVQTIHLLLSTLFSGLRACKVYIYQRRTSQLAKMTGS